MKIETKERRKWINIEIKEDRKDEKERTIINKTSRMQERNRIENNEKENKRNQQKTNFKKAAMKKEA